jgi:hypothetical protein
MRSCYSQDVQGLFDILSTPLQSLSTATESYNDWLAVLNSSTSAIHGKGM